MPQNEAGAPTRKIGYLVRWSTPGQNGNYRGKEQDDALPAILRQRGYIPVPFHEGQVSGRDLAKRDVALDLLTAIETGEVDGLAGFDVKRITRDETGLDAGRIIRLCVRCKALICTADRDYAVWQRTDLRDFKRDALDAGENLLDIRDTFWSGYIGRVKREAFWQSGPPVGYTTRDIVVPPAGPGERSRLRREPIRDERAAGMMAELGQALDECLTIPAVVQRMNAGGHRPTGHQGDTWGKAVRWAPSRVETVIFNTVYSGTWTFGRYMADDSPIRRLPNAPQPIHSAIQVPLAGYIKEASPLVSHAVPELAWYDADRQRAWQAKYGRADDAPHVRMRKHNHVLLGVLTCGTCHEPMIGHGERGYACRNSADRRACVECKAPEYVGEQSAFDALWAELPALLAERADAKDRARALLANGGPAAEQRAALDVQRAALKRAVREYMAGDRAKRVPDAVRDEWDSWQAEIDQAEAGIRQLEASTALDGQRERVYAMLLTEPARARDKWTADQAGAFFRAAVSDVVIGKRGRGRNVKVWVAGRRNRWLSTEVSGASAGALPAYLTGLLA